RRRTIGGPALFCRGLRRAGLSPKGSEFRSVRRRPCYDNADQLWAWAMMVFARSAWLLAGLCVLPAGCGPEGSTVGGSQAMGTPGTPGWTGRTTVVGSHSTIGGNAEATEQQQKWPLTPTR